MAPASHPRYECVVGFNHEPKKGEHFRCEPGEPVEGKLPPAAAAELLAAGVIREVQVNG